MFFLRHLLSWNLNINLSYTKKGRRNKIFSYLLTALPESQNFLRVCLFLGEAGGRDKGGEPTIKGRLYMYPGFQNLLD